MYRIFPSKTFCLEVPKKIRKGIFYSVIDFGYRINLRFKGLSHDIPSKLFLLTVTKHFVKEPLCAVFQKISGSEKVYG